MKRLLCILILFQGIQAGATHWLTYHVYYETEYIQGPWSRSQILNQSGYRYLAVREYTDLFGTEQVDLADKTISRLKELHPTAYEMDYTLEMSGDTVILELDPTAGSWDRIRNEVTATMTMNSFRAVCFRLPDTVVITTMADVDLPYFDLVPAGRRAADSDQVTREGHENPSDVPSPGLTGNRKSTRQGILLPALLISIALNLIFIIVIVKRRRQ